MAATRAPAVFVVLLGLMAGDGALAASEPAGPEAPARSHGRNYKDMVLAGCIARAYKDEPAAGKDATASAGLLVEWTQFDLDRSEEAMDSLIDRYLARDYRNPLADYKGVDFKLLKCLDLYHSQELDQLARKFVAKPQRSFRQDQRPAGR